MIKNKKMKAIYWADPFLSFGCESVEDEFNELLKHKLNRLKIRLSKIEFFDVPQCLEKDFDVLFFDWGGMSMGNSMLEHLCRHILKHADDHPSRAYVMVSSFTEEAMKDASEEMGKDKPANVYLNVEDFAKFVKVYEG